MSYSPAASVDCPVRTIKKEMFLLAHTVTAQLYDETIILNQVLASSHATDICRLI
jgi:hypothetical protein